MKKIFPIIVFILICSFNHVQANILPSSPDDIGFYQSKDVVLEIANHFKNSNSKEISNYFSSTVNLSLVNKENVYSSAQTEIILNNFLKSNPPNSVKVIHRLDSHSNYQHAVILLSTSKGDFRVAYSLKGAPNELKLIEIRIEEID